MGAKNSQRAKNLIYYTINHNKCKILYMNKYYLKDVV